MASIERIPSGAKAYEHAFRQALRGKRLVYEAGLEESMRGALAECLNELVTILGPRAREELPRQFPAIVVVALAVDAVFAYDGHTLWPNLLVHDQKPPSLGKSFNDAIDQLDLEKFAAFDDENAQKYVSRILAHGGIPKSCLNRYFEFLERTMPSAGFDIATYQDEMRNDEGGTFAIPRPVKRFLLRTGSVGEDFLARSLELLRDEDDDFADTLDIDTDSVAKTIADKHGLPRHVVKEYRDYRRTKGARHHTRGPLRVPHPRVVFDLDGDGGPRVVIPAYKAGAEQGSFWTITPVGAAVKDSKWPKQLAVLASETRELALPPAAVWRIALSTERSASSYDKTIPALRDNQALVFHARTGAFIEDPQYCPAEEIIVLAPCTLLSESPSVTVTQHLPPVNAPAWEDWQLYEVTVRGSGTLAGRLTIGEQVSEEVRLAVGVQLRPTVQISDPLIGVMTVDGDPVFSGPPAIISIPWSEETKARWRGSLLVNGSRVALAQDDLDDVASLTQSIARLIPRDELSKVRLVLQGSLGESARHEFVVLPGLTVRLPATVILPDDAPQEVSVECDADLLHAEDERGNPFRKILVDAIHLPPAVAVRDNHGRAVALQIRPERLLWRLVSDAEVWPQRSSTIATLRLAAGQPMDGVVLQVSRHEHLSYGRVVLMCGDVQLQSAALPKGRQGSDVASIRLGQFRDTIERHPTSGFIVALEIGGRRVPVVQIVDDVQVLLLSVDAAQGQSGTRLMLRVRMSKALSGLFVRVSSVDRPWRPRIDQPMLGGAQSTELVELSETLPPGRYNVAIGFTDPWRGEQLSAAPLSISATKPAPEGDHAPPSDPRDLILWSLEHGVAPALPEASLDEVAPAMVLLLASHGLADAKKASLAQMLSVDEFDWHKGVRDAGTRYGVDRVAALGASLYLLEANASAFGKGSVRLDALDAPVLTLSWLVQRSSDLDIDFRREVFAKMGIADSISPSGAVGGKPRLKRGAEVELGRLQRIVCLPLSPNGRAKAMTNLLIEVLKDATVWSGMIDDGPKLGLPPLQTTEPTPYASLAREVRTLWKNHRRTDLPSLVAEVHLVSMASVIQLLVGGSQKADARQFLERLVPLVPDYAENRLLGALAVALTRIR
jgi:hypothetical protein